MAGQLIRRGERTWLVRVYLGRDGAGKRTYHSKTIHGPKKDAERYLTRILRQRDTGELLEPARQTVKEYIGRWLDTSGKARLRPRTHEAYGTHARLYITPYIGDCRLGTLTPDDVRGMYAALVARGLSARTVRYSHSILHAALEQAVLDRLIAANPARLARNILPRQERKERRVLTPAEAARFLEAARGNRFQALWTLLLLGGLRPGEALALGWPDWAGDKVRIRRVLVEAPTLHFEEPKTAKSRRQVAIPQVAIRALREHRRRQAEERLAAGPAWQDGDLIFASSIGTPLFQRNVKRHWAGVLEAAELPSMRVYDLRHSCATLLLAAGVSPKIVAERLGHTSVTMTLDTYSHALPDMQTEAAAKLDAMLGGGTGHE